VQFQVHFSSLSPFETVVLPVCAVKQTNDEDDGMLEDLLNDMDAPAAPSHRGSKRYAEAQIGQFESCHFYQSCFKTFQNRVVTMSI
jgi:hypothetical protein